MKKLIIATVAAASLTGAAFAGNPVSGGKDNRVEDPFIPAVAAGSSANGVATAAAVAGAILLIGALAGSSDDSSSSATTTQPAN